MSNYTFTIYSLKQKAGIYQTLGTYFDTPFSRKKILNKWINEKLSTKNLEKLNNLLNKEIQSEKETMAEEILTQYPEKTYNTILKYLSDSNDYLSHWTYYLDKTLFSDLESEGLFFGMLVIDSVSSEVFIKDIERSLSNSLLKEDIGLDIPIEELIQEYKQAKEKNPEDELVILVKADYANEGVPEYLLSHNIISLKKILLKKSFHRFIENVNYKLWEIQGELTANNLVEEFVFFKYNAHHKLIKYILKEKNKNLVTEELVKSISSFNKSGFLEDLI